MATMRIRRTEVSKPASICLACFNAQQQYRFPFLVYCVHNNSLALVHSAQESSSFTCAPAQLNGLLAKLDSRIGSGVKGDHHGDVGNVEALPR